MNIALVNPPFHPHFSRSQRSPGVTKSGTFYYPYWLAYAAGVLEQQGHGVRLLDAPAAGINREQCYASIRSGKPDLVVLDTSTPSINNDLEIALELKQWLQVPVALVGTHVSVLDQEILTANPGIDFIARREYEGTLAELAAGLEKGNSPEKIPGLSGRASGRLFRAPDRPELTDLDSLPFVSRIYQKHLNYRQYRYSITRYPVISILTSRGCPHQCRFCLYPQTFSGHHYRCRSVENIVEEFQYIRRTFPDVRDIFIEDDTFMVDRGRVEEFCAALQRAKTKLSWTANARADLDLAALKMMKAAGLRLLCVGFESFNPEVIKNIRKHIRLEQVRQFVKDAAAAGVMLHGCFIFGNPGDTAAAFSETLKFAQSLGLSSAQFFPAMPYPGTGLYEELKQQHCLRTEDYSQWVDGQGFHSCVVEYPGLASGEILAACNRAKLFFHLRPRYVIHKIIESLLHPGELTRNLQSLLALLRNSWRGRFATKKCRERK